MGDDGSLEIPSGLDIACFRSVVNVEITQRRGRELQQRMHNGGVASFAPTLRDRRWASHGREKGGGRETRKICLRECTARGRPVAVLIAATLPVSAACGCLRQAWVR